LPDQDLSGLRERFLSTFRRALEIETAAVRQRSGPATIPVSAPVEVAPGGDGREWVYRLTLHARGARLLPDQECRLRLGSSETPVTLLTVTSDEVTLRSDEALPGPAGEVCLVVYPWFLYERLGQALAALADVDPRRLRPAFTAFGCCQPTYAVQRLALRHGMLNRSQGIALGNCLKSSCAFIWGPPGTGKTTTLARILLELLEHRHRVLVTSGTNAAVDQVLRALQRTPEAAHWLAEGRTVRVGSPEPEWQGLTPWHLAEGRAAAVLARRQRLRQRRQRLHDRHHACSRVLRSLADDHGPRQMNLFGARFAPSAISAGDLVAGLSPALGTRLAGLDPAGQRALVTRRLARLQRALDATDRALLDQHRAMDGIEQCLVHEARLVTATAAAVTVNRFLHRETFDTVVIEEAAMVPLPMVFVCAARAASKVLVVGDPMQLPPIVQSADPFVVRAMARTVFAVAAPNPFVSPLVSLLDEQYRMHPRIGDVVSRTFYGGRLRHAVEPADLAHIVQAAPYRGSPLVLVDTAGQTACEMVQPGPSRCNERSAMAVAALVREALAAEVQSIAVITPYTAQARLIREFIRPLRARPEQVVCRTVHGFQGNERDLVIMDTVDTAPFPPGVLVAGDRPGQPAANLVNVAVSRARGKLIVVADRAHYLSACPRAAIARVIEECAAAGVVVPLP